MIKIESQKGFSLVELIVTITIIAVLAMGAVPLVQTAVKRQKEAELRETLRAVRQAIDEFKRDSMGGCLTGGTTAGNPINPDQPVPADPRTRVVIDDCKIFTVDNPDHYPPDLKTLVEGVRVKPRGQQGLVSGGAFSDKNATDNLAAEGTKDIKKIYLRKMPIDPITEKDEWNLRSSYQEKDSDSWDEANVFDIRSKAEGEALNGEKYADW